MLSEFVEPGKRLFAATIASISRAENVDGLVVDGVLMALQFIATWKRGLASRMLAGEPLFTSFLLTLEGGVCLGAVCSTRQR
jgi:hypothetical protein